MSVFVANEQPDPLDTTSLRSLAETVIADEGYPESTEVAVLFVTESEMSRYNEQFLDREGPTDVLAFPVEDLLPGVVPDLDPNGPPLIAGDVVIAPSYVRRQAEKLRVDFEDEMALMVAHGILHLLGYDHDDDRDAEHMERRERDLLSKVGRVRR